MKKKVNIKVMFPIYTVVPPIVKDVNNKELSVGDIALCMCRGARVEEVFDDGEKLLLDFSNYNKKNESPKKHKEDVAGKDQAKEQEEKAKKEKEAQEKAKQEQADKLKAEQAKKENKAATSEHNVTA